MSIAANIGSQGLIQLGVSITDVAVLLSQGRRFGNWLTPKTNDLDLFASLGEPGPEVLLKRRGLVEPARMECRFPDTNFIHDGRLRSSDKFKHTELSIFSWLMVVITAALDLCLSEARVTDVLVKTFVDVLDNPEAESSLRLTLPTNINSWRSYGIVRRLALELNSTFRRAWEELTDQAAVPELNQAEEEEMVGLLHCLLEGVENKFRCHSAVVFASARAIQRTGIWIVTDGNLTHEGQFVVDYLTDSGEPGVPWVRWVHTDNDRKDPLQVQRGTRTLAMQISYPAQHPESMIQAALTDRSTKNSMGEMWLLGSRAAEKIRIVAKAATPYSPECDIWYELEDQGMDAHSHSFEPKDMVLASKTFPVRTQLLLDAIAELTAGLDVHRLEWLETHLGLAYLQKNESESPSRRAENMNLWLKYQALVFGFYYKLVEPLVCLDYTSIASDQLYFQGLWGHGSTTFLAMCTQFGQNLRSPGKVSRSHLLHMLGTMYAGRSKVYSSDRSRVGLVAILGRISIVAMSLLRIADDPQSLARFAILDLPSVQLIGDDEGELYAGVATAGIKFLPVEQLEPRSIRPRKSAKQWSVQPTMARAFRGGGAGVVMAARCGGRLVGWFSLIAADTLFLSTAYCRPIHAGDGEHIDEDSVSGFEVTDADWEQGRVWRASSIVPTASFGVVNSIGNPKLRYAAAGFYGGAGEEVAIATDSIEFAFGRIEQQHSGIIIT